LLQFWYSRTKSGWTNKALTCCLREMVGFFKCDEIF